MSRSWEPRVGDTVYSAICDLTDDDGDLLTDDPEEWRLKTGGVVIEVSDAVGEDDGDSRLRVVPFRPWVSRQGDAEGCLIDAAKLHPRTDYPLLSAALRHAAESDLEYHTRRVNAARAVLGLADRLAKEGR